MGLAAGSDIADSAAAGEPELAIWREEIRRHALTQLACRPAKPPRFLRISALVFLLSVHAVLLIALRVGMHRSPATNETAVEVRFLDADLPEPQLPVPSTPRPAAVTPRVTARVIAAASPVAPAAAPPETAVSPQLFNPDGSIRVPPEPRLHAPTPQQISAELMQRGHNILRCRRTRFASGYKRDESVGDEIARKYLVWIGMYNADFVERKAAQRQADAAAACDG